MVIGFKVSEVDYRCGNCMATDDYQRSTYAGWDDHRRCTICGGPVVEAPATRIRFESGECGRCDGSGSFGPRIVNGGRCFDCKGTGRTLTTNGSRARSAYIAALNERTSVEIGSLVAGDQVWHYNRPGTRQGWVTVISVEADPLNPGRVAMKTSGQGFNAPAETRIRKSMPAVQLEIMRDVARRFKGASLID